LDLGLVKKRETAARVYYEIDTLSPLFNPLSDLFGSVSKPENSDSAHFS